MHNKHELRMSVVSHPEVDPLDVPALRDLVRFGVMADDQLARRYANPSSTSARLLQLKGAGVVKEYWERLEGASVFEATRLTCLIVGAPHVNLRAIYRPHLSHDVAVVDLADYLTAQNPSATWVSESELRDFLNNIAPAPQRLRGDTRHRPDGLLVSGDRRTAIELEHSDKYQHRYAQISGWFVRELRVDSVTWYVDDPRIGARLREVNARHGFDRDMQIDIHPFPPGVRLRQPPGRYRP